MGRSPTRFTLPCDPVVKRQARLDALLTRFDCAAVLIFKSFDDGAALPRIAEKHKQQRLNEDRACRQRQRHGPMRGASAEPAEMNKKKERQLRGCGPSRGVALRQPSGNEDRGGRKRWRAEVAGSKVWCLCCLLGNSVIREAAAAHGSRAMRCDTAGGSYASIDA